MKNDLHQTINGLYWANQVALMHLACIDAYSDINTLHIIFNQDAKPFIIASILAHQKSLIQDVYKIFDREYTGKNQNCSFRRLQSQLQEERVNNEKITVPILEEADSLVKIQEVALPTDIRNKLIAHNDYERLGQDVVIDIKPMKNLLLWLDKFLVMLLNILFNADIKVYNYEQIKMIYKFGILDYAN